MKKLFVLCFLLWNVPAWATTYYTAKDCTGGSAPPNCSDANDGLTRQTAELTVAAGIAHMATCDTLTIGNGTYNDQILGTIPGGSSGCQTIVQAENANLAILLPTAPTAGFAVINLDDNYITLDGLIADATNCQDNGGYYVSGTRSNIIIKNGTARNGIIAASSPSNEPNGILLDAGSNYTIQNMDIHDFRGHGIYDPSSNTLIEGNNIHDWVSQMTISGYGIQVYGSSSTPSSNTVRNNTIDNWDYGMILSVGSANVAYNNILSNSLLDGVRIRYSCAGCLLYNNTIYNSGTLSVFIDNTTSGSIVRNNIFYSNGTDTPQDDTGSATINTNLIGTNPNFNNPGGGDFSLTASSLAAINAGADLSAVFGTDIIGTVRPQGTAWDVGAYEYNPGGGGASCDATDLTEFDGSEDPLSEAGCWASTNGASGHTKVSGFAQAKVLGEYPNARWANSSLPSDHYTTIVWNFNTSASWDAYQVIRLNASNAGYEFHLGSNGAWQLNRRDGGSFTTLQSGTITPLAIETIRVSALASTITVTRNGTGLTSAVDSTYSGSGRFVEFGIHAVSALTDIKADSFEIGTPSGGGIEVLTPTLSSIQQRPASVSTSWTVSSDITSGTVELHYSFDGFVTQYMIAQGVAYNGSPFVFTPTWPTQSAMQIRVCQGAACGTSPTFVTLGQYLK